MASLLQLVDVTKSFGAIQALRGVSLDLRPGEVHALIGENGAGKSTLIRIVSGAHRPDSGTVSIQQREVTRFSPLEARRQGVACIYQQPALLPDLSVAENIGLRLDPPGLFRRVRWKRHREVASDLLQQIGAHIPVDREVRRLSMSELQLVEIASAIGTGANIVIMDEPTASLGQAEQIRLQDIIRTLCKKGAGVLYISHRLEEIEAIADRITILRDGSSVGTHCVADIDRDGMIQAMVGRSVSHSYPRGTVGTGAPVLSVSNLRSADGGVHGIQFDLKAGEIVGIAGLVGAGRTELARVLFGITPVDSGIIQINGQPVHLHGPRTALAAGIAYVPEDRRRHGVIPEFSVSQNITLSAARRIFPKSWLRSSVENPIARSYIQSLSVKCPSPDVSVATLSGGNQQKVALARALETNPKVLILDEPTQGIDVGAKGEIHRIVRGLAEQGMAVMWISSDLSEVLGMSDRLAVMRGGTITSWFGQNADPGRVLAAALGQEGQRDAA